MTSQRIARKTGPKQNIDWKREFIPVIRKILEQSPEPLSVRETYYIIVSQYPDKIANTRSIYNSYDKATVDAREDGSLPEDAFVDNTRRIIDIEDQNEPSEEYIQRGINHLKNAHLNYAIPRWSSQPNYVEVWIEKDATTGSFYSILRKEEIDREVRIVPNRGWSSRTFVKKNIERLLEKRREGKNHLRFIFWRL